MLTRLRGSRFLREVFVFLTFCLFTATLTWPYVTRLRDAVVDPGDPYFVTWVLWWDYHQTFSDPLNLFNANLFYPLRYTLAFSEHCYGIALLFFPLFALGARPLTVHAIAMFFGFVTCGYGAFRLARTLTASNGAAWVAGIIFAFVPFRFGLMSQLPYLWSCWIPLLFEALVLFSRERSKRRALWLGVAFFMSGITTISWFNLSLVPFVVSAAILLTRHDTWRDRDFWRRGVIALGAASLALVPFMLPYFIAARLYNFQRSIDEVKSWSAWPSHWLAADGRNKLWHGMGDNFTDGRIRLFPGLLAILLSLAALLLRPTESQIPDPRTAESTNQPNKTRTSWVKRLDVIAVCALALSIPAIGYDRTSALHGIYKYFTSEVPLALLSVAVITRMCLEYPAFLRRGENTNFIQTLRSGQRSDAFWLGLAWTIIGFCYSLGWNFFFYRILYDVIPLFRSMRVVVRGSMFAYLGIAILAGLGAKRLAEILVQKRPRLREGVVFAIIAGMLLLELNAAPLGFMRGDVFPDGVTERLKATPMHGGVVVLPANEHVNHRHVLRSADHMQPLIVGISGFGSPYESQIEAATAAGPIPAAFMNFLEDVPASYLVVENNLIEPQRRVDYETFVVSGVLAGRLRFINRFDGRDDLYAVVKNEPQAKGEAQLPFALDTREWDDLIKEDSVNILGQYRVAGQALFRFYLASFGQMPRYAEFVSDAQTIGRGVTVSSFDGEAKLESNLHAFADKWVERKKFATRYEQLTDERYVDELTANAGIALEPGERSSLIDKLTNKTMTRAAALLALVQNQKFIEKEQNRSLVLLHYFGYLHRNPDDLPDQDLAGFNFWLKELEVSGDPGRLARGFMASGENKTKQK
ncbi:MAG TPA: hypothetical protein VGO56_07310 [Pyrinomonadaceae bacterium]|jgi:hypothetical protein|nr:hypothetical protein [Pyrinomonadaceae bacterium]